MFKTPLERIKCVVEGYLRQTESHIVNLILVIREGLHLVKADKSINLNSALDFLFNLSSDPHKAYQTIKKIRSIL